MTNDRIKELTNLVKYHSNGITGKGILVGIMETSDTEIVSGHRIPVEACLKFAAPDCEVKHYYSTQDGVNQAIKDGVDIMNFSVSSLTEDFTGYDGIIVTSAGNTGELETGKPDRAIIVGAIYENSKGKIGLQSYSSQRENIDCGMFIPYLMINGEGFYKPSGTSFSSPVVSGMIACYLQHKAIMDVNMLVKNNSVDILAEGFDVSSGYGYFKLPEVDMDYDGRWSEKAIDFVKTMGYMNGDPDGKFRPTDPLTREEMAQILYNIFGGKS